MAVADAQHMEVVFEWLQQWKFGKSVPANIILLASVENQEMADKRIPELLKIPAARRGLSMEPLLGPISFKTGVLRGTGAFNALSALSWCVVGGESGKQARLCKVEWIRSVKDQCHVAGTPCFVKQLGSAYAMGTRVKSKLLGDEPMLHPKGGDPSEWPSDLRVRQWPEGVRV